MVENPGDRFSTVLEAVLSLPVAGSLPDNVHKNSELLVHGKLRNRVVVQMSQLAG